MNLVVLKTHKPKLGLGNFFDDAQKHKGGHPAIISSMYKLSRKVSMQTFTIEFLQCLSCALVQKEKSPYSLIALEFAAKFCCHHSKDIDEDDEDIFLRHVVSFITQVSDGKSTVARLRVCEFLNLFLSNMSTEATIDEDMYEAISECMLDRAMDKLPTVRIHAFAALQRLQEPLNLNCAVTKKFIYHLECDPSAEVRRNILKNIAITQHSLPAIISRSRDFNEAVRKEMYQTIAKIKPKRLRIKQRQEILTNGLNDSSEVVRDHVLKKLIPAWLDDCERDYLKLLELFYVELYSIETVNTLLVYLFKRRPSAELLELVKSWQNASKVIPADDLTTEKALIWLSVVKYFQNPPSGVNIDKDAVDEILPGLTSFSQYLREFFKRLIENDTSTEFIFMRLLELVLQYSLTDENGREEVKKLCRDLLLSNKIENEELVKLITRLITFLVSDVSERLELVVSIVDDVQHPLEDHDKSKVDLDIIEESFHENPGDESRLITASGHVANLDFENIKMLPKCLHMLIESLKANDINYLHPVLDQLAKTFLTNCFKVNSYISSLAISALSLLCLKDGDFAKKYFIKFLYYMAVDALLLTSIESIFDQLIFYGLDICLLSSFEKSADAEHTKRRKASLDFYDDPTIDSVSVKHLFNRLSTCLFSEVVEIRSVACQGFAKLFLLNRIHSSIAFAELVILWFSPDYGSDASVSQPLGIFFDLYAKKTPNAAGVILNALIPALEYLNSPDCDSNLEGVDPVRVANLLLDAVNKAPKPEEGPSYHFQAANLICDEILARGIKSEVSMFISLTKCFYHLEISKSDKDYAEELMSKLPVVLEKIDKLKEKSVKKVAISFYSKLNSLWNIKKSNNSRAGNESKKSNGLFTDDTRLSTDCESQMDDSCKPSCITLVKGSSFLHSINEPIIEEYSGSDEEGGENHLDNEMSELRLDKKVIPGTPESKDSGSDSETPHPPPKTRRNQKKLNY